MKAYVRIPYTDAEGTHAEGEEVEFPRNTEEEKAAFDTLVDQGLITTRKSELDEDLREDEPDDDKPAEEMTADAIRSAANPKRQPQG
jgi:hypothetical protein